MDIEEPCVELECHVDVSDALVEQGSGLMYILDKYYCERKVELDPNLSKQCSERAKHTAKAKQRAKIKAALRIVLPSLRAKWKKMGLKFSRQQLLESLVPCASQRNGVVELLAQSKCVVDSEVKLSAAVKGVKKSKLKSTLKMLCSSGPKGFFVKFKAKLMAGAPDALKAFVEAEAPPPLPPPEFEHPIDFAVEGVGVGCDVSVVVEDACFQRFMGHVGKVKEKKEVMTLRFALRIGKHLDSLHTRCH